MNFPYRCPQCGVLVRDITEAEWAEGTCDELIDNCSLSSELDKHEEPSDA
jgi:hypothetical protein